MEPCTGRKADARRSGVHLALLAAFSVALATPSAALARSAGQQPVSLERVAIAVDAAEPSYIQYGARDLAGYLTTLGGHQVVRPRQGRVSRLG